jgi:hypothetical protein
MRYGVCDTTPTRPNRTGDVHAFWDGRRWNKRTTQAHVRTGLPGWVCSEVVEAKTSADPAATIAARAAEYRAAGRLVDASIVEDQARAFGLLPRTL